MTEATVLAGGTVITADNAVPDLLVGDVLVVDGRIAAVGENIPRDNKQVVDVSGHVVMPGFIDTHRHTWQGLFPQIAADWSLGEQFGMVMGRTGPVYSADDLAAVTRWGRLEALNGGVTTMADWCHLASSPEYADAALDALTRTPGRSVFMYGGGSDCWGELPFALSDNPLSQDLRRIAAEWSSSASDLITLSAAVRGPELSTDEATSKDIALARDLGLRISMHVGVGDFGVNRPGIEHLRRLNLLGPDITYVHCTTCTDDHLREIVDSGATVSISPNVELIQGHGDPPTGRVLLAGIEPSLSIDNSGTAAADMFNTMRATLVAERALDVRRAAAGQPTIGLTTRRLLDFATRQGAESLGLGKAVGRISPGMIADVIVVSPPALHPSPMPNPVGTLVLSSTPSDVRDVMVNGAWVKRNGKLVDVDIDAVIRDATAARNAVAERAGVPTSALSWAQG